MARLPRIPDLLTTANLCCGTGSILLASQGQLTWACWLVFAGAAFDVLDGLAARALGGGSELGKQLDSLADMVTFGVAPMFLLVGYLQGLDPIGVHAWASRNYVVTLTEDIFKDAFLIPIWVFLLSIPICAAWRLAKFNIDQRQSEHFIGLPTPANALFWASSVLAAVQHDGGEFERAPNFIAVCATSWMTSIPMVMAVALVLSILMLSSLPLPSLKFGHYRWRGNEVIYLLLGIGAVLVVLYGVLAVPLILLLYLLSPLWGKLFPKTP